MKAYKKIRTLIIIAALTILASAASVSAAGLNKTSVSIKQGNTVQLSVKASGKVTWKTSKSSVATVSKTGKVTGKNAGSATVTAVVGSKKYTCKVAVAKKTATTKVDNNTIGMTAAERKAYKAMIAKKSAYYEGRTWTNSNFYKWNGGIFSGGCGCSGFAFLLSDAAFGKAPARQHRNFNNIKVGDIVRLEYNTHSVIVLKVVGSTVVVAEGNYGSSIHWGRTMTISEIKATGTYVMTRWQ